MSRFPAGASRAGDVRERWRATSLADVWLRPGDWYHPAVDALAEAVEAGRGPGAAAARLGAARGANGVGMGEAIDDLMCLYRAMGRPTDPDALRALSVGWAESHESAPSRAAVRDPATGLPTADYLCERLRETYGEAQRAGTTPAETACLVVLDVALDDLDRWRRTARSATVGRTLDQVFGEGHPMAALTDGLYAVLCPRDRITPHLAQTLRRVIEKNAEILGLAAAMRRPTRVWIERLPTSYSDAVDLVGQLAR
ncbi:hypothetical protein ET495_14085 [Xylanimonas allomyrinae]|uniref:Uncharacterized protein n=1 Tax=Xylanimonas allomyrinae TaxID=2509459 RepID=A0A4V0YEG8_9MICO|nr:hypothetical protein [Xylanimonas allomyrinae]QAY64161.1 hypothetical protein ET495_14085 [Xylanimonas allomyrinae]